MNKKRSIDFENSNAIHHLYMESKVKQLKNTLNINFDVNESCGSDTSVFDIDGDIENFDQDDLDEQVDETAKFEEKK